jgi:ABC-type Fe3+ transport system substrate-binding protein
MANERTASSKLHRRRFLALVGLAGSAALLGACQQAPAAQPAPAAPPSGGAAKPAAAAPTAAASASAADKAWQDLIAAARQEGKMVLVGPPNPDLRANLPPRFKERFGVDMEYLSLPPNQTEVINRLVSEKDAGIGTVDVLIGGAQSMFTVAYPAGIMAPVRPALVNPEALDASKWTVGKVWFKDPEDMYFMQMTNFVVGQLAVNADYVKPSELTNWQDLLDPKFTGKISAWDPTLPGTGWNTANWLRTTFGDDYLKRLYVDQKAGVPADARQWADWLARGTYPIAVGPGSRDIEALKQDGFHLEVIPPFAEAPGIVTGGYGLVLMLKNAPNPNAAKLFANWIVMREGQEAWGRLDQVPSIRTDLDNSWAPSYTVPKPGVNYFDSYDWNYVNTAFAESIPKIRQMMALR